MLEPDRRGVPRGARPRRPATGSSGSAVESFVESGADRPALPRSTPRPAQVELGPAIRVARRRLAAVRRDAAEGRARCGSRRYRHGGGRSGNVAAGTLTRAEERDPRRRHGHEPAPGLRRRRPRVARQRRARAPRWRSAPATARSPPTTSSSCAARHRRGWPARDLPAAGARRVVRGAHPAAGRARRPAAELARARARRGAAARGRASTSTSGG